MRHIAVIASLLLLTACSNLSSLSERNPQANDFPGTLAAEYLEFAKAQAEMGDTDASEHFAAKGLQTMKGYKVLPDEPSQAIGKRQRTQLVAARTAFVSLLSDDMRKEAPQQLARAQLLLECWLSKAAAKASVSPCKEEYESALADLNEIVDTLSYGVESEYDVAFAEGSAELEEEARAQLTQIAQKAAQLPRYRICFDGYTGPDRSFRKLAQRRIEVIRAELIKLHINPNRIEARKPASDKAVYLSHDEDDSDTDRIVVTIKTLADTLPTNP
ncbi:MAG: OmpA family protein [Rickettsiales bacterium]|nr:OmpA family protein [Rickettsiales bacterium]